MFFHLSFIVGTIVRICLQYLLLVIRVVHRMRPQKPKRSVTTGHQRHCSPSPVIVTILFPSERWNNAQSSNPSLTSWLVTVWDQALFASKDIQSNAIIYYHNKYAYSNKRCIFFPNSYEHLGKQNGSFLISWFLIDS